MTSCSLFRVAQMAAVSGVLAAGLLVATPTSAAEPDGEQKRLAESAEVLTELMKTPDDAIPEYILERAEAIVVIPQLVKGGFVVGAQHGKGVMSVRNRADNTWSTPGFVTLTGGSFGWQIGLQSVDLVLVVTNPKGVQELLDTEDFYGKRISNEQVVRGLGPATQPDARAFVETLQRIAPATRTR
jgi:SH3 domain-containing YSC84-like protein 1